MRSYGTVAAVIAVALLAGCGGSGVSRTDPDQLAQAIGAEWCADSDYMLENKIDGSREELYSCNMPNGSYKCVVQADGIARDVTAEARLVFSSTLGADKPDCLTS